MSVFGLNRERIRLMETALWFPALLSLGKAVESVFGSMCDPRIKVAGAPAFETTAILGAPVWAAFLFVVAAFFVVATHASPRVSSFLRRFRLAILIGCFVSAMVLPMLPFPHRVLGACLS